jgi:PAS domain S-box-containing protein
LKLASIRTRLVLVFLAVALIPLILGAALNLGMAYSTLTENRDKALVGAAAQTAELVDSFILDNLSTVRSQATLPYLSEYLEIPAALRRGSAQETRSIHILDSFRYRDPEGISSYALFDREGNRLLDTHGQTGREKLYKKWFEESIRTGQPHVSSIMMSGQTGSASLFFSSPLRDSSNRITGLIRVRYNAAAVQRIINKQEGVLGPGSVALLLDDEDIRIADSHDRDMSFRPLTPLSREKMLRLSSEGRSFLPVREADTLPGFREMLRQSESEHLFNAILYPATGKVMRCVSMPLKTRPWTVVVAQPRSVLTNAIFYQVYLSSILFVAMALASMAAAILLARKIARPIVDLTSVAGRIAGGDLDQKVDKASDDEIGTLGDTFNAMALALRKSREGLQSYAEKLEVILDTTPDALIIHTPEGKVMDVNRACTDLYGYSREELLKLNVSVLSGHGHTRDLAETRMARAMETAMKSSSAGQKKGRYGVPVYVS